ncbi:MAG: hypothetical protein JWO11_692 [Nocardioides sp.]|nr:hypothetical protein [Nocardioides sp.]
MTSDPALKSTHSHGAWRAHHAWHENSTSVEGQFEDGTRVDIATWQHAAHKSLRAQAWNEWLHGRVLVVNNPTDDAPPVIIVPLDRLTDDAVKVAVSSWSYGHVTEVAA